MIKCSGCRKEKEVINFTKGEKILKKCLECREKSKKCVKFDKIRTAHVHKDPFPDRIASQTTVMFF